MSGKKDELKKLFQRLHKGEPLEHLRDEFKELLNDVSPMDLAQVEEDLVKSGVTHEEIHKMCDIHLEVIKEQFESQKPLAPAGHPIAILMEEHKIIIGLASELKDISGKIENRESNIEDNLTRLVDIAHHFQDSENHYQREENVLFPYLEKHGITEPPAMMWIDHGRIREIKKNFLMLMDERKKIANNDFTKRLSEVAELLLETVSTHYYKENNILFPASLQVITKDEWPEIRRQFDDLGYCCFTPESAIGSRKTGGKTLAITAEEVSFETGNLTPGEISGIFNNLPVDITFVGSDDTVRYFSETKSRIFARAKAIIGRTVQQCHPQKSIDKVNQVVQAFKSGKKDTEEFWINLNDRIIYIRYFAVRDHKGKYIGTMEVTQDITDIKKITGEKRL